MNIKTTLVLLTLVGAGVLLAWFGGPQLPPSWDLANRPAGVDDKGTRDFLQNVQPSKITRIEVQAPSGITELIREPDGAWSLPGHWKPRKIEVETLIELLAGLRSRFQPQTIDDKTWNDWKSGRSTVAVLLTVDGDKHKLDFAEKPADSSESSYSRDTYLRLDDKQEALRLAPGLIAALDKPRDYYQQRRLFEGQLVKKDDNREKLEQLAARSVSVADAKPDGVRFTLVQAGSNWELAEPVRDRIEDNAGKALLAAVPDIWAEKFVPPGSGGLTPSLWHVHAFWDAASVATDLFLASQGGLLVRSGLLEPERTITVKDNKGNPVCLQIGRLSRRQVKMVPAPQPPGMPPGMGRRMMPVTEEYRYAKLQNNDQIFEIKGDKLKEVFVALDALRDSRIARFNTADAVNVTIRRGSEDIVLEKDKDNWKLVKPFAAEADNSKVNDLLNKLSDLQARDKDILDKEDPKKYNFDKPAAVVTIVVKEEAKSSEQRDAGTDDKKEKKERKLTLLVGKHDADKKKLYVMAEGLPRINVVEDSLEPLVTRSALAYRGKRLLDFTAADVAKIDIDNQGRKLALEHGKDGWELAGSRKAEADLLVVEQMAGDLGRLEAVEYVDAEPKKDDLQAKYGLGKSPLTVRIQFSDKKKPEQVLHVGKKHGKDDYYARLGDGPVFTVNAELRNQLARDALSYRPRMLWQFLPDEIVLLRIHKAGQKEYSLTRSDSVWKISGPFEANAFADTVQKMTVELGSPKIESYKTDEAKDLAEYGLDKPALTVTVRSLLPRKPAAEDDKEHTLLIGKATAEGAASYYAKRASDPAIFTVGGVLVRAVDRGALDVLNRTLLEVDPAKLERVQVRAADNAMTLEKKDNAWRMVESPAGVFPVDGTAAARQESLWLNLQAERFAAYGSGVEWSKYGLDKPGVRITIKAGKDEHTVELGNPVESEPGARYVRVDEGKAVAVLPLTTARVLTRTYLDYVNRSLLKFDGQAVTALQRRAGDSVLEIVKKDDAWQMTKPIQEKADETAMQKLCEQLGELRAAHIAAYPVKDLKPFGLDAPSALVTIKLKADAKPAEHVIKLGKASGQRGERFALVDDGKVVAVLPASLAEQLAGPPLAFRERALARFDDADRLQLERGPRRAVFSKADGSWKLTAPLPGEAEQDQLNDFLKSLSRLRADVLVAEKPDEAQLKKYGLERPETQWRVQSGDKDVLNLLIGDKEAHGTRRYAKLAKGDLVFLLDPRLSQQVHDEYRPRAVWSPPLDAVQIESLNYRYSRNPFFLEKDGANWQAVGKADAKINAAAVEDALAALAGLKLSRYVVDKDANLALFGLDKPELILEAATRSGKRVLHVGNVESESKGRYARIPEGDRSDVFLLDEETCARLLRDLAAFGRPPARPPAQPAAP